MPNRTSAASEFSLPLSTAHALALCLCLAVPGSSVAGTYWVAPTGASAWEACTGETPLAGAAACSLQTANANVAAGDVVFLRGGVYDTHIAPSRSGASANARIAYRGYGNEEVVIRNTSTIDTTYYHGIYLRSRSFIWIDRVKVDNPAGVVPAGKGRPLMITHGASHNEISNCEIDGNGDAAIQIWRGSEGEAPVTHNWIHHCYIHHIGRLVWNGSYVNDEGGMQLGVPGLDDRSGNNTFEHNTFACGAHHTLETFTKYNVISNNFFHNAGCLANNTGKATLYGPDANGLWGNRNIQVYDELGSDGMFNLLEGNRFGPSGPAPDDDGGDGLTITAPGNVIRYNEVYGAQNNGVLFKTGAMTSGFADNNRFYNNTIFFSGRHRNSGPQWQGFNFRWYGSYARVGNVIKNNILNSFGAGGADWGGGSVTVESDNSILNNFCSDAMKDRCSASGSPQFIRTTFAPFEPAQTAPDLRLQAGSPAVDGGTHLTTTQNAGRVSTTLAVSDALYFQDGSWGSVLARHQADHIAIGTVDNVVRIARIDYSSNTITLAQATNWNAGDRVWLYQRADGLRVLFGPAPDYGAHEAGGPAPPASLRIVR